MKPLLSLLLILCAITCDAGQITTRYAIQHRGNPRYGRWHRASLDRITALRAKFGQRLKWQCNAVLDQTGNDPLAMAVVAFGQERDFSQFRFFAFASDPQIDLTVGSEIQPLPSSIYIPAPHWFESGRTTNDVLAIRRVRVLSDRGEILRVDLRQTP